MYRIKKCDTSGFSLRRRTRTIFKNLILLIKISNTSHLFDDVQVASQIECACRRQRPLPFTKKNLLRQVKLPVGSSKKSWDRCDVVWAYPVPFRCHVFRYLPSKQDWENSTAFPTHAARSCYKTCTNTLIVFLNTASSDLLLRLRKLIIIAL